MVFDLSRFVQPVQQLIADISLSGYLFYPVHESGYEVAGRFPNITAWLDRLRALPGWATRTTYCQAR